MTTSPEAIAWITTPNLAVQRDLALLAALNSATSDISLSFTLASTVAAQTETADIALTLLRLFTSAIASQTQTSDASLIVARALAASIAAQTGSSDILLQVLRDLSSDIYGQSITSDIVLNPITPFVTAIQVLTEALLGALAVERDLSTAIAIHSVLSEMVLFTSELISQIYAITQTSDAELILTFHESLLAKSDRFYRAEDHTVLEAAALAMKEDSTILQAEAQAWVVDYTDLKKQPGQYFGDISLTEEIEQFPYYDTFKFGDAILGASRTELLPLETQAQKWVIKEKPPGTDLRNRAAKWIKPEISKEEFQ